MRSNEPASDEHKARVQAQFGATASAYVTSATHSEGNDLEQLVQWAEGGAQRVALDVATGGGHTALAIAQLYGRVVASDLTMAMLEAAEEHAQRRGVANLEFRLADAEELPFDDGSFDLVTCRIAPHHFGDVSRFVREVARVLRPSGIFLLEDSVAPAEPDAAAFLNRVEKLRDSTHVRTLSRMDWLTCIADTGLVVEAEDIFAKTHPFRSWVDRAHVSPDDRLTLEELFRTADPEIRAILRIVVEGTTVVSYSDEKLLVKARKPGL
jgi:ubiquinone/menaquinone biosynthesis C-methylase UbiE